MFTRFHDDPARIEFQLRARTFAGRYAMDTPGPGIDLPFQEDPHLRLQRWGANLRTETVNLESDLIGLTRTTNRDHVETNDYIKKSVSSMAPSYRDAAPVVEESRASLPAWRFRDLEHPRWEQPWLNPQAHLEKPFHDMVPTRLLEKDYFKPELSTQVPCDPRMQPPSNGSAVDYYLTGRSMCLG